MCRAYDMMLLTANTFDCLCAGSMALFVVQSVCLWLCALCMQPRTAWIATLSDEQRWRGPEGRYVTNFNAASHTHLANAAPAAAAGDVIVGAVQLCPGVRYNSLERLNVGGRAQYSFWQSVFGGDLEGRLFLFNIGGHLQFAPQPIMQCFRRPLRTFFVRLEVGLPARLLQLIPNPPEWLDAESHLCLRLPAPFSMCLASGDWQTVCIPDPDPHIDNIIGRGGRERFRVVGWSYWSGLQAHFGDVDVTPVRGENLNETLALNMADEFRCFAAALQGGGELDQEHRVQLHRFAYVLQRFHDDLLPTALSDGILELRGRNASVNSRYHSAFLIKCLLTCQFLRDSANLKHVVRRSVDLCLPPSLASMFSDWLNPPPGRAREGMIMPSASKISVSRLLLDVAFMQFKRKANHEALLAGGSVRYMLADSSVQGHRDFELVRMHTIPKARLVALLSAAHILYDMWSDPFPEAEFMDDWMHNQDLAFITELSAGIDVHAMPVVVIGSARGSLRHKFHSVMHALFLESACTADLEHMSAEICSFTTDQGVEFGFHRIEKVSIQQLFPWAFIENAIPQDDEFEFAPLLPDPAMDRHEVDVTKAVGIAGLLHIIHNTSDDLGCTLVVFDDTILGLSHISNMIRKETTRDRLFESCFSSDIGRHLRGDFKGFNAKVHKARWGTIAHAVVQLATLEHPLRFCWSKARYGVVQRQDDESTVYSVDLEIVDHAITSPFFWASLKMLLGFSKLILRCFAWAEGCPCHSQYPRDNFIPKHVWSRWERCPLRGRRAPCLAAGNFMGNLVEIVAETAAELVVVLPNDISQEQRAVLLRDFERGRQHLVFAFSLRLAHWRVSPWCIYGCAHGNYVTARYYVKECLTLASTHSLFRRLQTEPIKSEAQRFVDGESLETLDVLSEFLGELFFTCTAERSIEGDHAKVPSINPLYMSV
jgi:hypothetical protein